MKKLLLGVSIACLVSLSIVADDAVAQSPGLLPEEGFIAIEEPPPPVNQNTNTSASGSLNAVGIENSNAQSQVSIGSISDSFKAFDIGISESFRIEGNDTDIASGNTVDSLVGNSDNFNDNIAFNDNNAIDNDGNLSGNAVDNDGNVVDNDGNANGNVVDNDFNAIDNDGNASGNWVDNDGNIIANDNNTINPCSV